MKKTVKYKFHYLGIPTDKIGQDEKFSQKSGMYTYENDGKFKIQWHRFTKI